VVRSFDLFRHVLFILLYFCIYIYCVLFSFRTHS
jgi:hypothetical protein